MEKVLDLKVAGIQDLASQKLKCTIGGSTCPSMGDYYAAGFSGAYVGSFLKGVIKGIISYF
jgi:hypothetical protein